MLVSVSASRAAWPTRRSRSPVSASRVAVAARRSVAIHSSFDYQTSEYHRFVVVGRSANRLLAVLGDVPKDIRQGSMREPTFLTAHPTINKEQPSTCLVRHDSGPWI
jgi:hypothetical protein